MTLTTMTLHYESMVATSNSNFCQHSKDRTKRSIHMTVELYLAFFLKDLTWHMIQVDSFMVSWTDFM